MSFLKTVTSQEDLTSIRERHEIRQHVDFETLVLAFHCYSGDNKQNTDFLQITCFKECKNTTVETFEKHYVLQLSHGMKNIYVEANCSNDIHIKENILFVVDTFEDM